MESHAVTYGSRIKFNKEGKLLVSQKIYSNGHKMVRVVIDTEEMIFKFVDPASGISVFQSEKGLTNLEVLQRHVKKSLKSQLGIKFDKEKRNVSNEKA